MSHLVNIAILQFHLLWVWPGDSWNISGIFQTWHTLMKFGMHMHHDHTNKKLPRTHTLSPTGSQHFDFPPLTLSIPRTLTNSSYRSPQTSHSVSILDQTKMYIKNLPRLYILGMAVHYILIRCHKASSPYNLNIQFPISTKLLTHVEGVTLNKSMHQYCVITIPPPTGCMKSASHQINQTS